VNELTLLFLLLPVAVLSGWYSGRRSAERSGGRRVSRLSTSYFRGLNYLLNEQPDKAIEVFLQISEVDSDTVETHFALGNLFRRRGEVDRAIRIHQNLIERSTLNDEQRVQAVLELGEDYMRAGLLDRAETLFADLVRLGAQAPQALRHLLSIYQQERDWEKAIEHAQRLEAATGEPMGRLVSHFHCELAERARRQSRLPDARAHLAEAFVAEANSVRAGIIEGQIELAEGRDSAAVRAFERVARHDPDSLPEVLKPLLSSYERMGERARGRAFLAEMSERFAGVAPVLALAKVIREDDGDCAAVEYLSEALKQRPSVKGQVALIELGSARPEAEALPILRVLGQTTEHLASSVLTYRCHRCGFGARQHHWQCPSCKGWSTVRPIHGPAGD
jgi:lipopolysaccharide biosynthesis regulator YciM